MSDTLEERIQQFDAAIRRIAESVGAVCGGVDTEELRAKRWLS